MKAILTGALVLAVSTSAVLADGAVELTDPQLDQITAGLSIDSNRARRPGNDVIDTTLARNGVLPSLRPEARRTVPGGGARFPFLAPPIRGGGARVANPGVNVVFVPLDLDDLQNLFESR